VTSGVERDNETITQKKVLENDKFSLGIPKSRNWGSANFDQERNCVLREAFAEGQKTRKREEGKRSTATMAALLSSRNEAVNVAKKKRRRVQAPWLAKFGLKRGQKKREDINRTRREIKKVRESWHVGSNHGKVGGIQNDQIFDKSNSGCRGMDSIPRQSVTCTEGKPNAM